MNRTELQEAIQLIARKMPHDADTYFATFDGRGHFLGSKDEVPWGACDILQLEWFPGGMPCNLYDEPFHFTDPRYGTGNPRHALVCYDSGCNGIVVCTNETMESEGFGPKPRGQLTKRRVIGIDAINAPRGYEIEPLADSDAIVRRVTEIIEDFIKHF